MRLNWVLVRLVGGSVHMCVEDSGFRELRADKIIRVSVESSIRLG